MSVAAGHPHLVSRLVLVDASPEGPTADAIERAGHWFESWPRPIRSEEEAAEFFGAAAAPARLAGMERREDGWWPRFDDDITLATWEGPRGGWRDGAPRRSLEERRTGLPTMMSAVWRFRATN